MLAVLSALACIAIPRLSATVALAASAADPAQGTAPRPIVRPAPDSPLRAPGDALSAMVAREHAFAAAAGRVGMKAAFLEFLDDSAIALVPAPTSAKAQWRSRPDPADPLKTRLAWEPRIGEVARSGDLGWLSGPYSIVPDGDAAHTGYGCYFSLWRRQADGLWLVVLDQGIQTPEPCVFPGAGFSPMPAASARGSDVAAGKDHLLAIDRAIRDAGALAARLDERARIYRPGYLPFVGIAAAKATLAKRSGQTFTSLAAETSSADDLAYTYGTIESGRGYYVRVWRRAPGAEWRVIVDVQTDLEAAQ